MMLKELVIPTATFHEVELPLTTLHYVKCGTGPPLIMPPATMSELEEWLPLVQFMGQRFTVYFFELPGYGKSTPFPAPFSCDLIAETVEALIDRLGFRTVTLMSFSFGGLLVLKALHRLQDRVEKIILISPCVSTRAIRASALRLYVGRRLAAIFKSPVVRRTMVDLLHNQRLGRYIIALLKLIGKVEKTTPFDRKILSVPPVSLDTLAYQINEILTFKFPELEAPFRQPCYFAMSVRDPLLDFEVTLEVLEAYFEQVFVERFDFPYHRPPELPTFEGLMQDYGHFLEIL